MLKESQNYIIIEGTLSEVDLSSKSFTDRNGVQKEALGGSIKVKVAQEIDGVMVDLEVPVHMFATKYTNAGGENPAYKSINTVKQDFNSIAAVGADQADKVRITGAKITMNEYYSPEGKFVSFPRVSASFVTKIKPEDCKERAAWQIEGYIGKMGFKPDADGIDTDTFELSIVVVGYGEKADIIPVVTRNKKIIAGIQSTYGEGDTVPMSGKLNFSSSTETILEEVEIGDPIEKTRTINVSELIMTGMKAASEGDMAYTTEEIQKVLNDRSARLAAAKDKSAVAQNGEKKAPANNAKVNLGF